MESRRATRKYNNQELENKLRLWTNIEARAPFGGLERELHATEYHVTESHFLGTGLICFRILKGPTYLGLRPLKP